MMCEMETVREIWNDMDKSHLEIGPDRDGLGCVELRYYDEADKVTERMSFPPEMALHVSMALECCARETSPTAMARKEA